MWKAYTHISVFYLSAISRDIDLKFVHDTNRIVINSPKHSPLHVEGHGHRDGILLFEGTVISQKMSHRTFSILFCLHLFVCPIKWNNNNLNEQRNDVTTHNKYVNIWHLTCKTPLPKLLFFMKSSKQKSKKHGSHTAPSYSYSLSVCQIWWRLESFNVMFDAILTLVTPYLRWWRHTYAGDAILMLVTPY